MVSGRHRHGRGRLPWFRIGLGGAAATAAIVAAVLAMGQVAGGRACASVVSAAGAVAGTATYYTLASGTEGNCSYPSPPADGLYVALSPAEYGAAAACGGYLEVSGPDGTVRVEVTDQCPPCATGHIDLSQAAFAQIAPLSAGQVSVTYQAVADPPLPAPVALRVKEGSSQYWLALLAMNTGNPLTSVQVETASGGWLDLVRANYNYWIAQSGAGSGPFTVRLTDTAGHQVTVQGIALEPGVVQDTGTWMYGAGTGPAPLPAATSTAATETPTAGSRATRRPAVVTADSPATVRAAEPAPATTAPASPGC